MLPLLLGLLAMMLLPAPMQWRMPGHATPPPRPCPLPDPKYRVVPYPTTGLGDIGGIAPRPPRSLVVYQGPVPPPPENNWSTDDLYEVFDTFEMLPPWDGDQA